MTGKQQTPSQLIAAIQRGSPDAVNEALDNGADIEEADMHGMAGLPLRTACFNGNVGLVRQLVSRGADINAPGSEGPGMPLRLALRRQHQDIVELLISLGAEIPVDVEIIPRLPPDTEATEQAMPTAPEPEKPAAPPEKTAATAFALADDIEAPLSCGTDTSLLTIDLLHFNESENENNPTPTPSRERNEQAKADAEKAGFWESGTHFR